MRIPDEVRQAVTQLNNAGFEAYPVGGCVRDLLRGKQPHDWDITTSALPEQTAAIFAEDRTIPTGLQHGTLTVLKNGMPLEITTYRVDGDYADGRHPDRVTFTRSLTEDLARRDFTINAMALDIQNGVVDPFFGQEDLKNGVIRCVGDPDKRLTEDALRLLRALRFSSVLGFTIEPKTAAAIRRHKERLALVSAERITEEMTKLLCGGNVENVLTEYADVVTFLIPEISPLIGFEHHHPYHIYDVFTHTIKAVSAIKPIPELRWAMLLHDIGKVETFTMSEDGIGHFYKHTARSTALATDVLRRFRFSGKQVERILLLVKHHDLPFEDDERLLLKRLRVLGEEVCLQLLELQDADCLAQAPSLRYRLDEHQVIRERLRNLCENEACFTLKDLAINGNDLAALGIPPGPSIGRMLEKLLEAVMEKRVENTREALINLAKNEK